MNTRKPPLESRVVKKILDYLRSRGGYWEKNHGSIYQTGRPDIEGCYHGRFVGFEVKRDAGIAATQLQQFKLEQIRKAGGVASLIHSVEEAAAILDSLGLD